MGFTISMRSKLLASKFGLVGAATAILSGCAGGLTGVTVTTDPAIRNASIQVDVVGANAGNRGVIEGFPVSKYFQSGNAIRQGASAKSFRFGGGQSETQSVTATDPIWAQWKANHVQSVVVMADVPGVFD